MVCVSLTFCLDFIKGNLPFGSSEDEYLIDLTTSDSCDAESDTILKQLLLLINVVLRFTAHFI